MAGSPIQGFLFDLNGVFYVDNQAIAGSAEAIKLIKERQIPCRFVTNTTTKSLESFHQKLTNLGLPIEKEEVINAPYAAVLYLKQLGNPECYLLLEEDAKRDFAQFPQSDTAPDVIVVGDIGDRWNYDLMNQAFTLLNNGAELVALHKGKYWQEVSPVRLPFTRTQVPGAAATSSWRFPPLEEVRIPGFPRNESAVELANPKGRITVRYWRFCGWLRVCHWKNGNRGGQAFLFFFPVGARRFGTCRTTGSDGGRRY